MDPLLCFPADLPAEVTLALQSAGLGHLALAGAEAVAAPGPDGRIEGYSGALVVSGRDMTAAVAFCRHLRMREIPLVCSTSSGAPDRACAPTSLSTARSC
jgi:hypothetical protein